MIEHKRNETQSTTLVLCTSPLQQTTLLEPDHTTMAQCQRDENTHEGEGETPHQEHPSTPTPIFLCDVPDIVRNTSEPLKFVYGNCHIEVTETKDAHQEGKENDPHANNNNNNNSLRVNVGHIFLHRPEFVRMAETFLRHGTLPSCRDIDAFRVLDMLDLRLRATHPEHCQAWLLAMHESTTLSKLVHQHTILFPSEEALCVLRELPHLHAEGWDLATYQQYVQSCGGMTPKQIHCTHGNEWTFRWLILHQRVSPPRASRTTEWFLMACRGGWLPLVKHLLSLSGTSRVDVHARHEQGFRWACKYGHGSIVKCLLRLYGDRLIDVHAKGEGAFYLACRYNQMHILRQLLQLRGKRLIQVDAYEGRAFLSACEHGHLRVVECLLRLSGAQRVDVHVQNDRALFLACKHGRMGVLQRLLQLKGSRFMDTNAHDVKRYRTPFGVACVHGHMEVVNTLLNLRWPRDVDVHDFEDAPIIDACHHDRLEVVLRLLGLVGERSPRAATLKTIVLPYLCSKGQLETVRRLMTTNDDRRIVGDISYCFMRAAEHGHLPVVDYLLGMDEEEDRHFNVHADGYTLMLDSLTGSKPLVTHHEKEYAFCTACANGHTPVVQRLLTLQGKRRIDVHAVNGYAWNAACANGHVEVVHVLLGLDGDRRIDVHVADEYAFRAACAHGHLAVVELLLTLRGDRRIGVNAVGGHAFMQAYLHNQLPVVKRLLEEGAEGANEHRVDVHADEEHAFRTACSTGSLELVDLLLSLRGTQRIDVHAQQEHAFRMACRNGHMDVVQRLLGLSGDRTIDVHAHQEDAFLGACRAGHDHVVKHLLELRGKRRIHVHARRGQCLLTAIENGHTSLAKRFLKFSGDRCLARDVLEQALKAACAKGNTDIVERVLRIKGNRKVRAESLHKWRFFFVKSHNQDTQETLVRQLKAFCQGTSTCMKTTKHGVYFSAAPSSMVSQWLASRHT